MPLRKKTKPQKDVHAMNLDAAVEWRQQLRREGKKLVVTNGCFDIIHRGHVEYLAAARNCGDAMLVLVNSDESVKALKGPSRPVNDEYARITVLEALRSVDAAVVFMSSRCDHELDLLEPDIYVKGGDYTVEKLDKDERAALEKHNTEIRFIPFIQGFSTTSIIEKMRS